MRERAAELSRRARLYCGDRPAIPLAGRTAIVVYDGLATGLTDLAAVRAGCRRGAARVIVGAPVGSAQAVERAMGVTYRPATERASHYCTASLSRRFDALVHVNLTRAVEPLERTSAWELGEPPETDPRAV